MIEIEFSALARLCLDRRIPTQEQLATEVLAFLADRSAKQLKITWQFSLATARTKLNSPYCSVHPDNAKYRMT